MRLKGLICKIKVAWQRESSEAQRRPERPRGQFALPLALNCVLALSLYHIGRQFPQRVGTRVQTAQCGQGLLMELLGDAFRAIHA